MNNKLDTNKIIMNKSTIASLVSDISSFPINEKRQGEITLSDLISFEDSKCDLFAVAMASCHSLILRNPLDSNSFVGRKCLIFNYFM